jgi:hypothetical protein
VLITRSRQDLINNGNFFCSVPVDNMKTDHFLYFHDHHPTHCVELDLPHLHTTIGRDEARCRKNFLPVNFSRNANNCFKMHCHLYRYLIHALSPWRGQNSSHTILVRKRYFCPRTLLTSCSIFPKFKHLSGLLCSLAKLLNSLQQF